MVLRVAIADLIRVRRVNPVRPPRWRPMEANKKRIILHKDPLATPRLIARQPWRDCDISQSRSFLPTSPGHRSTRSSGVRRAAEGNSGNGVLGPYNDRVQKFVNMMS